MTTGFVERLTLLFRSRKVLVGIASLIVAAAARYGFKLDPDVVAGIVAVAISVILGISIEDAGAKVQLPTPPAQQPPDNPPRVQT